jgi:ATP-binding cassette subfamily B multidrug efflux pump
VSPADGNARAAKQKTEQALKAFHEEGALGKAYDARLLRRVWTFVHPYRALLYGSIGLGLVMAAFSLARPYVMRVTIDEGAIGKDPDALFRGGVTFAAIILLEQILSFAQAYAVQVSGTRAMADLRQAVFAFLHGRRLAFFDRQPVGRLVTRVTNDVDAILELFASGAVNAFVDLARLIGIIVIMLQVDWKLSLIGFAAAPFVGLLVAVLRPRAREAFRVIRAKTAQMNATMNEQVSGMAVVQAFGRERAAAGEFDDVNRAYRDANMASIKYDALQDAAIEMVASVCLASIVVALGYHPVSFGTVVMFNGYLLMFFEPINMLAQRYTLLQNAVAGAERVFGLLDGGEADAEPRADAKPPARAGAMLAFEQVSFEYKPGVPVLREVSFEVRRGEKIAIVGPTGAGKSTVAALFLRLYDAGSGTVRVEDQDVLGMGRQALRSRFAVVPQDVFLFPGTVESNIAIGDAEPDHARVRHALERLDALDLFEQRPGGLSALVNERGENFSAGERQLIAFARALYRDAPILVLDEATASVDSATEARVQRALDRLMQGRTSLVIAHRLSTIRAADRILCFQRGRLVEQGSHAELLASGGLYARLHQLHFARAEAESVSTESAGA